MRKYDSTRPSEHGYKNDAFAELVKDAILFFNGPPVHRLPPPESLLGTGVYAIYYTGKNPVYKKYAELNPLSYGTQYRSATQCQRAGDKYGFPTISSVNPKNCLAACGNTAEQRYRSRYGASGLQLPVCYFWGCQLRREQRHRGRADQIEYTILEYCRDGFGNHDPGSVRYEQVKGFLK